MMSVMHPEEFQDTDPKALEVWMNLQRSMTVDQKLAAVLGGAQLLLQSYEMGVRSQFPTADDAEVLRRVAARHLPRELMIAAYGWDPEDHGIAQ